MRLFLVVVVSVLATTLSRAQEGVTEIPNTRCRGCWCLRENANADSCPNTTGLTRDYPATWLTALRSFELDANGSAPALRQSVDDCFPFPGLADDGRLDAGSYPESNRPTCSAPSDDSGESVCVFVFDEETSSSSSCTGREYRAVTFDSIAAWQEQDNTTNTTTTSGSSSLLVHYGPCGVCSNAADLAARVETLDLMDDIGVLCATDYVISSDLDTRFANLVQCYQTNAKLSRSCATLWAHFGATNAILCRDECNIDLITNEILYNDPDTCAFTSCIACSADTFEDDFNVRAGIWKSAQNAGLVDAIIYPCDAYRRLETFDPCVGIVASNASGTPSPTTSSPTPENSGALTRSGALLLFPFVVCTLLTFTSVTASFL